MSYQLIASPGTGHRGVEPLTPRLEGVGSCCPRCPPGVRCSTGSSDAVGGFFGTMTVLILGLGAVWLAYRK